MRVKKINKWINRRNAIFAFEFAVLEQWKMLVCIFGNIWLTCELSLPAECVRSGPSLCRCASDCSAFTAKIMVVSSRMTPATHIWRWQRWLPLPLPTQYRWQFDDCISCILSVVHALCFLINTIFSLAHSLSSRLILLSVLFLLFC